MNSGAFSFAQPLMNSAQLAERLGMSRKALYHAIDAGQVPTPLKIGNRLRWREEDITTWIEDRIRVEEEFRGQR